MLDKPTTDRLPTLAFNGETNYCANIVFVLAWFWYEKIALWREKGGGKKKRTEER